MHLPQSGLDKGDTPALVAQDVGFANILSKTHLSNNNAFTFAWAAPEVRHPVCPNADIADVAALPCRQSMGATSGFCMTDAVTQCTVRTPACCIDMAWKAFLFFKFTAWLFMVASEVASSTQAAACHSFICFANVST